MQLPKATGRIDHDQTICQGCNTCEAVCSLFHEGASGHGLSRLQILTYPYYGNWSEAITCKQCEAPNCVHACPTGVLRVDEKTGARVIDENACNGCMLCMEACPQYPEGPIQYDSNRQICLKCDLCGGEPQCVKFCPHGALKLKGMK